MSESTGRTRATAGITVYKYEPSAYDEPAHGPALTRIHVEESFSGRLRIAAEPAASVGVAALLTGACKPAPGERVAVTVSGANMTPSQLDG